jgi:hypothetical protein
VVVPLLLTLAGPIGLNLIEPTWLLVLTRGVTPHRQYSAQSVLAVLAIALVAAQSLSVKSAILHEMADGSTFACLYRQPDLLQLAEDLRQQDPARVVTVVDDAGPTWHPAYAWAYGLESADGYVTLYSQRYQDFWAQLIAPLAQADPMRRAYFRDFGGRVYLYAPTGGFPQDRPVRLGDYYDMKLLALANVRYIISTVPLSSEGLVLVPSNTREAQIAWSTRRRRDKLLAMVTGRFPGIPLYLYENSRALPRWFLAGRARLFDRQDELLAALREASLQDLQSTAYLQRADAAHLGRLPDAPPLGSVVPRLYSADQIRFQVTTPSSAILVGTNSYSPYWTAEVDGAPTTVFPVDHAFQGVSVGPGRHEVVLQYAPPYARAFRRLRLGG